MTEQSLSIEICQFGIANNKQSISKITLSNQNGIAVSIINFGATIQSIRTPDKVGKIDEIALGHDTLDQYKDIPQYIGALIGPYANRIAGGNFEIDGINYDVPKNENGKTSLHSGPNGFDTKIWDIIETNEGQNFAYVLLGLRYCGGLNNYPGNIDVEVKFTLNDLDELKIEYRAISDKKTAINLTSHAYFNLCGLGSGQKGTNCQLKVLARNYSLINSDFITTGEIGAIVNTPFDFADFAQFSKNAMDFTNPQIQFANGIDHNFILNDCAKNLKLAAIIKDEISGRSIEIETSEPCIQIYGGNHFDGKLFDYFGNPIIKNCAIAIEPQKFPNAINNQFKQSVVFDAGEPYTQTTIYRFLVLE